MTENQAKDLQNLQENLREFLRENSIYECLALNSQVIVVDKHFSCLDTLNILQENDSDDLIIWNSEISDFDGLITYTDVVDIVLCFYKNIILNQNNNEIFEEKAKHISLKIKNYDSDDSSLMDENDMEIEEDDDLNIKHVAEDMINIPTPVSLTEPFSQTTPLTLPQKQRLVADLKAISIKSWFQKNNDEVFKTQEIISIDENSNLLAAQLKMKNSCLRRIVVLDQESKVIVSTLTYKDMLLFIVRSLREQEASPIYASYMCPVDLDLLLKCARLKVTVEADKSVYQAFRSMHTSQVTSIPVLDVNGYLGVIHQKDIIYVLKENNYEMLNNDCSSFLKYVQQEKKCYNSTQNEGNQLFEEGGTIIQLVQQLLFAPNNILVKLDKTNKVQCIITLQDLFTYVLGEQL